MILGSMDSTIVSHGHEAFLALGLLDTVTRSFFVCVHVDIDVEVETS